MLTWPFVEEMNYFTNKRNFLYLMKAFIFSYGNICSINHNKVAVEKGGLLIVKALKGKFLLFQITTVHQELLPLSIP